MFFVAYVDSNVGGAGVGVGDGVGVGVGIAVGTGVGVGVGAGVAVGTGMGVGVGVEIGVAAGVVIGEDVEVAVDCGVAVGVAVGKARATAVSTALPTSGVGDGTSSVPEQPTSATIRAITAALTIFITPPYPHPRHRSTFPLIPLISLTYGGDITPDSPVIPMPREESGAGRPVPSPPPLLSLGSGP